MNAFLDWLAPVWRPHPGQERFLLAHAKNKVLACGRRWGKTDACAVQVLQGFEAEQPRRTLLVAPTLQQASFLYRRLRGLIEQLISSEIWSTKFAFLPKFKDSKLDLSSGEHTISARSAHNGQHLRGDEATDIVVDEAAYIKEHVVQEVLVPMMATTDGNLTLISTPNGHNYFYDYFAQGLESTDDFWSLQAPSSENPRVQSSFLQMQQKLLSPAAFATEYEAKFVQREGYVFDREKVRACTVAEPDASIAGPTIISIDWARYTDYSALIVLRGYQGNAAVLELDRQQRTGWREQLEWIKGVLHRYPSARFVCDTTGIGDGITAWLREEIRTNAVRPCTITAQSKPRLIDGLIKAFESGSLQIPPFEPLIRELENFRASRSSSGHLGLAAQSGHDDLVMALAMAVSDLPYAHRSILRIDPKL